MYCNKQGHVSSDHHFVYTVQESWDGFLLQIDKQRDHVTNTAHDDDDRMETRLLRVPLLDARTGKSVLYFCICNL